MNLQETRDIRLNKDKMNNNRFNEGHITTKLANEAIWFRKKKALIMLDLV